MNLSKRNLYALGEPLGKSVTRPKMGGGYVCGGGDGGSSSSSSANTTTTNNADRRMVLGDSAIGVGEGKNVTISPHTTTNFTYTDNGAMDAFKSAITTTNDTSRQAVLAALDTVKVTDAAAQAGFGQLLTLADHIFTGTMDTTKNTQALTAAAYQTATAEKSGTIDNKTITVLAIAGAVAAVAIAKKG